jgi:hypothetical protein
MKRFSLVIVIMLFGGFIFGHGNHSPNRKSNLSVKLWNKSTFKVTLNNTEYGTTNAFNKALNPGVHKLEVVRLKRNRFGNGFFRQVLYRGSVRVPRNSKVLATVSPQRKLQVKVVPKKKPVGNISHGGNMGHHHNTGGCQMQCCSAQSYSYVMSESSFNQLLITIEGASFDGAKLNIVEQALAYNNVNTEQVSILLNQFTFDSNRLKMAKMAYGKTIDKENYYLVNNQFTFNSSIANLNNYIKNYG